MVILHSAFHHAFHKQQRLRVFPKMRGSFCLLHGVRKDLQPKLTFSRRILPQNLLGFGRTSHPPERGYTVRLGIQHGLGLLGAGKLLEQLPRKPLLM